MSLYLLELEPGSACTYWNWNQAQPVLIGGALPSGVAAAVILVNNGPNCNIFHFFPHGVTLGAVGCLGVSVHGLQSEEVCR